MRLREMIKLIREAKTAADERDIVAKECADIRTSFKKEENSVRARNICKLIYVNLLGYATHFAQMDCLKLIVSNSYSDKRVGYLGLMMLLDERQEVLMLVTNSLKNDLRHLNQYVVGLALAAIGNIASSELARDCAPEVEKLLDCPNPYIRKKAALAAIRIIRKVPDLIEQFVPKVKGLMTEKNHGVLITGASLMIEMCKLDPTVIEGFRKLVVLLVRVFSSLLQYGFSPEYDVGGVTDPFLQVKILRLLRYLGADNATASDDMNVVLANVATNTDNVRNVGNSILYECVNTIMGIDSEAGLRALAINTLGKFLAHRDNNIRYVALNTLCSVVNIDTEAVQRHRNTVVDCLKDNDISIRRRALELVYSLVNAQNVRVLVRELVNFLQIADIEFRPDLTAKLCIVAEKYAPTPRWQIDTILRVMAISGDHVPDATSNALIALISQTQDIQSYAVQKMYLALTTDITQQTLVRTAVWCIGEFGDLLLNPTNPHQTSSSQQVQGGVNAASDLLADLGLAPAAYTAPAAPPTTVPATNSSVTDGEEESAPSVRITEQDLLQLFRAILSNIATRTSTKRQVLTAMLKLTTHMPSSAMELRALIAQYETHINVELQQRATEYEKILEIPQLPGKLLFRIPAPEIKAMVSAVEEPKKAPRPSAKAPVQSNGKSASTWGGASSSSSSSGSSSISGSTPAAPPQPVNLLDMDLIQLTGGPAVPVTSGGFNGGSLQDFLGSTGSVSNGGSAPAAPVILDLLADLSPSHSPAPAPTLPPSTFATAPIAASAAPPFGASATSWPGIQALSTADGISVTFDISKPQPSSPQFTLINVTYVNRSAHTATDVDLKISLPTYLKLQILPISSTSIAPNGGSATQQVKLANTSTNRVRMRLRLDYKLNGEQKGEMAEPQIPEAV